MRDDNGLTIPGTEGDTWEDPIVRCILCGEEMPKSEYDGVHESECDIERWEYA
jgi:hypothetical protein